MELGVWPGDWGLPSVDAHCLAVLAYCKFSEVPVTVNKISNPWKSPTGELPTLTHPEGAENTVSNIFNILRKNNYSLDHELTARQSADILAFTALIDEKLAPALLHLWWVDAATFSQLTRPWYCRTLPTPLNIWVPMRRHKRSTSRLQDTASHELTASQREQALYKDARECLNLLSAKLGDQEYFFGSSPSSLDALVFGHLTPLLKAPFPAGSTAAALQNHLAACPNLCRACQRTLNQHFPLSPEEEAALRSRSEKNKRKAADELEFPNRRRNMMIAGAVALTAMMGYAFMSGLIQIEVTDAKDSPDDVPPPQSLPEFPQQDGSEGDGDSNGNSQ